MRTGSASMDCAKSWRGRAGVGGLHPISKMWADSREFWGLAGGERRALTRGWGNPRNTSSRSRDYDLRVSFACKHFTWPDDLDWYRPGTPGRRCRGHLGPARSSRRDHAVGDTPKLPSGPRRSTSPGRTAWIESADRGPPGGVTRTDFGLSLLSSFPSPDISTSPGRTVARTLSAVNGAGSCERGY